MLLVAAGLLAGCGSDDENVTASGAASGAGYTIDLPEGWVDGLTTPSGGDVEPTPDAGVYATREGDQLMIQRANPKRTEDLSSDRYAALLRTASERQNSQLEKDAPYTQLTKPTPLEPYEIDGEVGQAFVYTFSAGPNGFDPIRATTVGIVHEDVGYTITFTSMSGSAEEADSRMDAALAGMTWSD